MLGMEPVESLKKIMAEKGIDSIIEQPDLLKNLMMDDCPNRKSEINLLVSSLREMIPQRLMAARTRAQRESVIGQAREQMQDNLGTQTEKAAWTVDTWLKVLPLQSNQPPDPPKPPPLVKAPPVPTPRQIMAGKALMGVVGVVLLLALVTFLFQVPEIIRDVSSRGMTAVWPPSRGMFIGFWLLIVGGISARKWR